ncbi:MAG TPA: sugar transferase [Thermoflexales bacterium]|nr:sugar transferase [Thermoflexales bacterium]
MLRSRLWLLALDVVLVNIGFVLGYLMRYEWRFFLEVGFDAPYSVYIPLQLIFTLAFVAFFLVDGVYSDRRSPSWLDQMYPIVNAATKATVLALAITFVFRPLVYSRLMIAEAGVIVIALVGLSRFILIEAAAAARRSGKGVANVLVVGAGEIGRSVLRTLVARPELGYRCVGFVDDDPGRGSADIGRFPALGSVDNVPQLLKEHKVDEVVVTLPWWAQTKILELARVCQRSNVRIRVAPSLLQLNLSRIDVDDFGGIPMISLRETRLNPVGLFIKRVIDIAFAVLILLGLSPFLGLIALLIKLESPGPVIFTQTRIGKNGEPFKVYKMRSMVVNAEEIKDELRPYNEADGPLFKIKRDPRITRIGGFIRRTSVDELPQFWNVLRGEMSVVGPRPQLPEEAAHYQDWQKERLRMLPGVTGLSQISGRSELSFDDTCMLDVYYVENWSLGLGVMLALKTLPSMLAARGAS